MSFMPAFHVFRAEAEIIGRLLAGYGELEYIMAMCLGSALADEATAIRTLYRMKGERLTVADSLLFPLCEQNGLAGPYTAASGGMRHCARIRNQFAHCNWDYSPSHGLFFVDLLESAKSSIAYKHEWKHIDCALLNRHEEFFWNTVLWWELIRNNFIEIRKGRTIPSCEEPKRLLQPPLYNPQDEHIPPWISLDSAVPEPNIPPEAE